jgi:natural product biosynthesis luciferase-like monooxygenase protein
LNGLTPAQRELLARRLENARPAARVAESPRGEAAPEIPATRAVREGGEAGVEFSLMFFSGDGTNTSADKYRLLFESAKYADAHGFAAVWTPERHFQDFGGLFPNPSVLSAALAMVTRRIQIRAGSVALPLHDPIRVAEEWSLVDNLSQGRVAVAFASGWHPDDFVLSPASYRERKRIMFDHIRTVQTLWAGESVAFPAGHGGDVAVRILPRPVQPELPIWLTSSGSPETWVKAGELGANVLTGLKGDPASDLPGKILMYRESLARHGHDPRAGRVTVTLHTYVGEETEAVREKVRAPLMSYLRTFIEQGEHLHARDLGVEARHLADADKVALSAFAFEGFFNTAALLGSPDKCARLVARLKNIGVDEIACLVDFGLDVETVIEGLGRLNALRERFDRGAGEQARAHARANDYE